MKYFIYLIVFIASFNATSGSYEDFFQAIKNDQPEHIAPLLVRGFDVNTPDQNGVHPLILAFQSDAKRVASLLLKQPKIRVEARNANDESPVMLAALGGDLTLVKLLIEMGADVNKTGWTPLHYAASRGRVDVMQFLLDKHAYVDAESPNKTTPLMMAAMYGTAEAVSLLLREGADVSLKNEQGLTALNFAEMAVRPDAMKLIGSHIKSKQPKTQW